MQNVMRRVWTLLVDTISRCMFFVVITVVSVSGVS